MKEYFSCKEATAQCLQTRRFAVAHLLKEERTLDIHIHDCYELYYSISGGRQFLIDNQCYDMQPGDLFLINNYESHAVANLDTATHERMVFCLHPDYVRALSDDTTDLTACFRRGEQASCRVHLSGEAQQRFMYLTRKLTQTRGYGERLLENAVMTELLVLVNRLHRAPGAQAEGYRYQPTVDRIIRYINGNLASRIVLQDIADALHLSRASICRVFKQETGVTINKYIIARRVAVAKALLAGGATVTEACEQCGAGDYANFISTFTRLVGLSPKQYAKQHNS